MFREGPCELQFRDESEARGRTAEQSCPSAGGPAGRGLGGESGVEMKFGA